jgi:ATP-dependent Clp protease adaptor protein ClpS
VVLHNDDYTTQDFVVWILETVYRKTRGEAYTIMMSVHRSGRGIAGVYTHDAAATKIASTKTLAEQHEFPLLVTMEPSDE